MEKVLVTGATGYIGLHCVDQLLKQGYAVNGSVRSPERKDEIFEALKKNHTPTDNLNIFTFNLTEDAGWDEGIMGCDYVLHVASPISLDAQDEEYFVGPAVAGVERALKFAKKHQVKKVERAHRGPKRTVERTATTLLFLPLESHKINETERIVFSFFLHDNRVARRSRTTTVTERTTEARDEIETEETANSRPLQRDGTERQRHLVVTKKANTRDLTRRRHLRDNRRLGTRRCRRRQRRVRGKNKRGNNEEKVVIDSKAARLLVPLLVVAALPHRLLRLLPLRPPRRSERWRIS